MMMAAAATEVSKTSILLSGWVMYLVVPTINKHLLAGKGNIITKQPPVNLFLNKKNKLNENVID